MSQDRTARVVEGGPLSAVADAHANGLAFAYLETQVPACHSDTGEVLIDAVSAFADCILYSPSFRRLQYVAAIARARLFAIGYGQRGVAVRLPVEARERALSAGEKAADFLGPEWIALELFRSGWTRGATQEWVRCAYEFALKG